MGNSLEKPKSLLDSIFGSIDLPQTKEPTWHTVYKKVTSMSNIAEMTNTEGYTATLTIPEGFNLDEINASIDGNVVTITVPRVVGTSKNLKIHKAE